MGERREERQSLIEVVCEAMWSFAFAEEPIPPRWEDADEEDRAASIAGAEVVLNALGIERLSLMSSGTAQCDREAWGHRWNIGDRVVSVDGEHKYDRDVPLFRVRAAEQFGRDVTAP